MSRTTVDEFPGLLEASRRAEKAVDVLHSAIEQLHPPHAGEDMETLALRLRGAAVLAHTAGMELATVSGWNEAAHALAEAGVLDGEEPES
jgi:hypothetical protein